jgi:hypothetical protein
VLKSDLVNSKYLPFIAVGAVAVIGLGAYFLLNSNNNKGSMREETKNTATGGPNTLRELLVSGSPQECMFMDDEGNEGTTYIAGGKIRTDYSTTNEGNKVTGHMILSDNTMYTWTDDQNTGFKMEFNPDDATSEAQPDTAKDTKSLDLDKKTDYSCKPWTVDSGVFAQPANVNFQSFSDYTMPEGMELPEGFDPSNY